ncbi:MAG TPA: HAD-IA family hydrolase [Stellaceae bacterium]|nr:HAD-IA family hydrolase [Stellaceae bacterium]
MPRRWDAVLFDLLTALLDSPALWNGVAGDADAGRRWRAAYLRLTYATGQYRPYEALVAEAAVAAGLSPRLAGELAARYGEIAPWPEATAVLRELVRAGLSLGIVTNCSEALGRLAAARLEVPFRTVVTAERAGFYKPDPAPYRLAIAEIGVERERCLFVAGSAYDLAGTARVGLATFWHDRLGMTPPEGAPAPLTRAGDLRSLPAEALG